MRRRRSSDPIRFTSTAVAAAGGGGIPGADGQHAGVGRERPISELGDAIVDGRTPRAASIAMSTT